MVGVEIIGPLIGEKHSLPSEFKGPAGLCYSVVPTASDMEQGCKRTKHKTK